MLNSAAFHALTLLCVSALSLIHPLQIRLQSLRLPGQSHEVHRFSHWSVLVIYSFICCFLQQYAFSTGLMLTGWVVSLSASVYVCMLGRGAVSWQATSLSDGHRFIPRMSTHEHVCQVTMFWIVNTREQKQKSISHRQAAACSFVVDFALVKTR